MAQWDADAVNTNKKSTTLTAARSTNPFFTDYQPQNSSVFSFFDDLTTTVPTQSFGPTQTQTFKIDSASVSYSVVGYHRQTTTPTDPLAMPLVPGQSAIDRLSACRLQLKATTAVTADYQSALFTPQASPATTNGPLPDPPIKMQTLCSGSLQDILFSDSPSNMTTPADDIQKAFLNLHPLSVGTNPVDALFGWLRAQPSTPSGSDPVSTLMRLQSFIVDVNEDLDSQLEAEDMLSTNNFMGSSGGTSWHLQPAAGKEQVPIPLGVWDMVQSLNEAQKMLDSLRRERQNLQQQLYYVWWKFTADMGKTTKANLSSSQTALNDVRRSIGLNSGLQSDMTNSITKIKSALSQFQLKPIVEPNFYMQRDPTLLIAGAQSKFRVSSGDNLNVRLSGQEQWNMSGKVHGSDPWEGGGDATVQETLSKLPDPLSGLTWSLIQEALRLKDTRLGSNNSSIVNPEYHNVGDVWQGQQGWFPLFIEWEVEYYDIPFRYWTFGPSGPESRYAYMIKPGTTLSDPSLALQGDYRVIKGRSPILPQTSATLEATLKQVFAKLNPDQLKTALGSADPNVLLSQTANMDYLSTPMVGFTDQLTTCISEAHFVPVTFPDGKLKVAEEAKSSGDQVSSRLNV